MILLSIVFIFISIYVPKFATLFFSTISFVVILIAFREFKIKYKSSSNKVKVENKVNNGLVFSNAEIIKEERCFALIVSRQEKKVEIVLPEPNKLENAFLSKTRYSKPTLSINDSENKYNHKVFWEEVHLQDNINIEYWGANFSSPLSTLQGKVKLSLAIINQGNKKQFLRIDNISIRIENQMLTTLLTNSSMETIDIKKTIEINAGEKIDVPITFRINKNLNLIKQGYMQFDVSRLSVEGTFEKMNLELIEINRL